MPEFHITHYNLIDTLIESNNPLWRFVCGVHSKCIASVHSVFPAYYCGAGVNMLTERCMEQARKTNTFTDTVQCVMNVYCDAALWAYFDDYRYHKEA